MNFCTYFDSNYAYKGWTCYHTIYKYLKDDLNLYIVCLDSKIYKDAQGKPGVVPILLNDIEDSVPEFKKVKNNRLLKEYYATMSPILPLYIFEKFGVDLLYYTDADMAFWSDPRQMNNIMGDYSLMVVDHGFEPPRANVRYNVGVLGYRNDKYCKDFLEWWKERCLEWCKWITLPDGRMADQGYLNRLYYNAEQFNAIGVNPIETGINLAPWNGGMCKITPGPKINGKTNIISYHYHEFRLTDTNYYPTGWKLNSGFIPYIYEPYYKLIEEIS